MEVLAKHNLRGIFVAFFLFPMLLMAGTVEPGIKTTHAVRTAVAPKIDGRLDDAAWQQIAPATDFSQVRPVNGARASQRTEVRIIYDNSAVYVGAMMYDSAPDSVLKQLGKRDVGENNSDLFQIGLDTYDDDQNAFVFAVSAAGVQTDMRVSQLGEDVVWDAVWKSAVGFTGEGWIAELEIPYSALRFPKKEVQHWGVQLLRVIRRHRETVAWNFVDLAVDGTVNQFGALEGIRDVDPPVRLQLTPYVSGYVERNSPARGSGDPGSTQYLFNAGADLKYGISESFTLDMTLVPDFGQVVSDNQVLNLSPFEVRFQENRPFFTEGTELFNIAGVFYSRRIGGFPRNFSAAYDSLGTDETVIENPTKTRLLNAFKLSGRTPKKTGLGLFNAMTGPSRAVIRGEAGDREVVTQPFTNYNVAVIDQSLRNNSYLSLINTNLLGADGYMANVTAARFKLADASNTWYAIGSGASSQKWDDVGVGNPDIGYKYFYEIGKGSGNFTFNLGQNVESHNYNPNDMGFLMAPNEFSDWAAVSYNVYKPVWKFIGIYNRIRANHQMLYKPRRFSRLGFNSNHWVQFKTFDNTGIWLWSNPVDRYDFFEARVIGRAFVNPPAHGGGWWFSSNYARRAAFDLNLGMDRTPGFDFRGVFFNISPRFRVNDKLQLIFNYRDNDMRNDMGFVSFDSLGNSIIGTRNRRDIENILTAEYTFTNRIALSFRARHYWSRVRYSAFEALNEEGYLESTYYHGDHNVNFNAFNIDCVFQWRFAPGSDIFIVWKNSILESGTGLVNGYFDNLTNTFGSAQTNSLSVRILYFLDYLRFKKK